MRRLLAFASASVAVLVLAGCAPETMDDAVLTPTNAATYDAAGAPPIDEIDLDAWAAGFMPETTATGAGQLKTEVLHAGESESAEYAYDGTLILQVACAADEATAVTLAIDLDEGPDVTQDVVCAVGTNTVPTVLDWQQNEGTVATVTITASVDTAIAIQRGSE